MAAHSPTGLSFFLLLFSFFEPIASFPQEISRLDLLETTIANSVDQLHPGLVRAHACLPFPK